MEKVQERAALCGSLSVDQGQELLEYQQPKHGRPVAASIRLCASNVFEFTCFMSRGEQTAIDVCLL